MIVQADALVVLSLRKYETVFWLDDLPMKINDVKKAKIFIINSLISQSVKRSPPLDATFDIIYCVIDVPSIKSFPSVGKQFRKLIGRGNSEVFCFEQINQLILT